METADVVTPEHVQPSSVEAGTELRQGVGPACGILP